MSPRSLASLFRPASVAVLGASEDPRKWGNWLARGALRGELRRAVYLVNRRGGEVLGRRAYRALSELPDGPELVVVAVPVGGLEQAVEDALSMGAGAIVAISAGDNDSERTAELDALLAARVRDAGAVLLGPNCLGVLDSGEQLELVPNPLPAGSIGLISQSGNLALELGLLAAPEGLGFSRFVSLGNQADLGATELVCELSSHRQTELIAIYIEDFRDGREFVRATSEARAAGKPVVLLAIERGQATTRAVRSHTGALATDGAVIDAACRAAGIHRVRTPRELIDLASALLRAPTPRGRRVAVLADGGGHGSIAASVAGGAGLELPKLSDRVISELRSTLPASAAVANPIDLAGGGEQDVHTFDRTAQVLLESGEVDAVLMTGYFGGYGEYGPELAQEEVRAARLLGEAVRASGRPLLAHTMYPDAPAARALAGADVPVYRTIEQAAGALAALVDSSVWTPGELPGLPERAPAIATDGYEAARALLSDGGIRFAAQRTVTSLTEARAAAREIGWPVVLKAMGLLHKSDANGVALNLGGELELDRAYEDFERRLAPGACSVEAMVPLDEGSELLIGARWDPRFGPVVLAGAGGIYAEILADTVLALAPVTVARARVMLGALSAAPLLAGARGRPTLDVDAAAAALSALSLVAAAHPELAEIEINPLFVARSGALALDARAVLAHPTDTQEPIESGVHLHPRAA